MKNYPNLVELWSTVECIAERCTKCGARWFTSFSEDRRGLGGVRCRLRCNDAYILEWPEKLCADCEEINTELDMIREAL